MTTDSVFRPRQPIPRAIYDRLAEEQDKRRQSRGMEWMDKELIALWEETNRQRAMLGKGPVTLQAVKDKERMAQGHIDYTAKCAYYCADLVRGP